MQLQIQLSPLNCNSGRRSILCNITIYFVLEYTEMNTGGSHFNEWSALGSVVLIWLLCSQESVSALISQSNRCVIPAAFFEKLRCVATAHISHSFSEYWLTCMQSHRRAHSLLWNIPTVSGLWWFMNSGMLNSLSVCNDLVGLPASQL